MDSNDENVTLSFVLSATNNCLPPSYLKLRSYLNVYSSNIARYFGLKLPKSLTNKNTSCPFCYTPWTQNTVSFKLFPSPRKRKKESSYDQNKTEESVYSRNKLVLQCNVCTKKSSFLLLKKKLIEKRVNQLSTDNSKKKKKKRKDKNKHSGLKLQGDKKVKKHNSSGLKLQNDKKVKKQNLSSLKNGQESLKGSNPRQVATCGKATTQNLDKPKKPVKNQTNIDNVATGKLKADKKNVRAAQSVINPNALFNQNKGKKRNRQKFKFLKKAISQEKITAKKTLKDFLTLVNK